MASSSRLSFWPTSVVCIVSSSLSAAIVLLVVHLVAPPNSRSLLSQLGRDDRSSPNSRPGELGDVLGGRDKRSLGDLPFYLSAHSAYEQGVFLELFKAVKANETFYDETMKILMPALVQFETIVIKEFRRIHLLIRRHDIRLRQLSPLLSSQRLLQARRNKARDDYYDDYDNEDSATKTTTTTTMTTTTTISTTTMTTTVDGEGEEAGVNATSSENSDETEGGGEVSSEEATEGSHTADCPCAARTSSEESEEDRGNSTHSDHKSRHGTLSENATSSDNSTETDLGGDFDYLNLDSWNSTDRDRGGNSSKDLGSEPDEDFRNSTMDSPNSEEGDLGSREDLSVISLANGTSLTLTDGDLDQNGTDTGDTSRDSHINSKGALEATGSRPDLDGNANGTASSEALGFGVNGTDGWNSTSGNNTDDYYDYYEEGNSTLDATSDATGDDATGDAAGVTTTISPEVVITASTESRASAGRGSSGVSATRVVRPRFDPTPIYRRLSDHSTRLDELKVATDSRKFKDKELDFRMIGLETAQKDQARRLREMETDNVQVTNKVNELLARLGLGSDDYRTLSLTVGRVERDVTDLKDSLAEMEAEWQELRLDTLKQKQIISELQTADSYKAHSIREVANLVGTMQGSMQHVLNTVDSYMSGLREEITKHIDDICYNNDLQCY